MSHHINFASSMDDQKHLTKSKESNSAKRRETKKLEIDNKQMEWRLNQLKLAMEKQKEERGKQSYIWKSAHDGALDSHARNILGRSVKSSSKSVPSKNSAKGKPKVKILTDEPLDIPKRKSHSKDLIEKLKRPTPPKTTSPVGSARSVERVNNECWISIAMDRTSDEMFELQSDKDGNLPLSSLHGINPAAIGLFYMQYGRKRLLLAIENKVMQPKMGWKAEVYFPYVANTTPQKQKVQPTPPKLSRSVVIKDDSPERWNTGGQLLNGSFDEEENAKSFQKALMEWRNKKPEDLHQPTQHSVEMVVHDVQSDPVSVDITFSETSTLTYMEKLLVKKHRETDVPPLPSTANPEDTDNPGSDFNLSLTEEELEEQARIRQLFTPQPSTYRPGSFSTFDSDHTCEITEVDSMSVEDQGETACYVEEVEEDDDVRLLFDENNSTKVSDQFLSAMPLSYSTNVDAKDESIHRSQKIVEVSSLTAFKRKNNNEDATSTDDLRLSEVSQNMKNKLKVSDDFNVHKGVELPEDEPSNQTLKPVSRLVHAIGHIPLNPDATYNKDVATLQTEMLSERNQLCRNLDQPHTNIMLCSQATSLWSVSDSVSYNPQEQDIVTKENEQSIVQLDENVERETEDTQALNQLEWELASQTGNVTSDGRISKLIDNWSSDEEELEIANDPGLGSGLSTPDHDPISLVGTSMSWQEDDRMQVEFQKMENFMFADVSSDDAESNSSEPTT